MMTKSSNARRAAMACLLASLGAGSATGPAGAAEAGRDYVIVCDDAGAGAYEAFPDVCRLRNGELVCVFYAGFAHVSLPGYGPGGKLPAVCPRAGRVCMARSSDNGKTWSKATVVVDTWLDDRDPSIFQADDGTLLCNYFSHRPGPGGKGYQFVCTSLVRSADGGRTWSGPEPLFGEWACSSPIRRLRDGRLALSLYYVRKSDSPGKAYGGVSFSSDGGRSWSEPATIGKEGPLRLDAEPDIVELPDGRLLAALRPVLAFSESTDGGKTWSKPVKAGFAAHCPYFLLTRGGILLVGHRLPGTSLHYSLDQGRTWSDNVQLDTVGGAYPSMVELPDGTIYCVYYEEGRGSDIRGIRFRATGKGIERVPFQ